MTLQRHLTPKASCFSKSLFSVHVSQLHTSTFKIKIFDCLQILKMPNLMLREFITLWARPICWASSQQDQTLCIMFLKCMKLLVTYMSVLITFMKTELCYPASLQMSGPWFWPWRSSVPVTHIFIKIILECIKVVPPHANSFLCMVLVYMVQHDKKLNVQLPVIKISIVILSIHYY